MGLAERIAKENERLKKRKESMGSFEKINYFKPKIGEQMIRILPGKDKKDEYAPFHVVHLHYINKELEDGRTINIPARCLLDLGEDHCPVCEAADRAMKAGNKDLAKKLRARETYLYNVIDYDKKEVMPWTAPQSVHTLIMETAGDIIEIFDIQGGRDWKVVKKQDTRKPAPLNVSYSIRPAPKDSDVPSKYADLIDSAIDLKSLYSENQSDAMEEFVRTLDIEDAEPAVVKKAVSKLKSRDEDDEDDDFDRKAKAKAAAAKAKAASRRDEDDEDEEDEEDEVEERAPKKKFSRSRDEDEDDEPAPKKKSSRDDEDEDDEPAPKKKSKKADMDYEDEDVEREMKMLMDDEDEDEE